MTEAYICDAIRTPIGRYGGVLRDVRTDDLAAHPIRALAARNPGVDWEALDDCIMGCANQAGEDNRNVARMAGLLSGLPVEVSGSTINRLCGSGLDAVNLAARAIRTISGFSAHADESELLDWVGAFATAPMKPRMVAKNSGSSSRNASWPLSVSISTKLTLAATALSACTISLDSRVG